MKLGLVSAILGDLSFEEMIDCVAAEGLKCVEVACWPHEKAARRYAGVCHIDTEALDERSAEHILEYCSKKDVTISALAYYPNMLDPDVKKREKYIRHIYSLIDAANLLNVGMVATFIGRVTNLAVQDNLPLVAQVWKPILDYAQEKEVKVCIENCPMLFTKDEWPGGQNLMTTPANWRTIFQLLDSPNLGLNFDPSHFIWQKLDYIHPIYEFRDKIFHVHFKDIKLFPDKMADVGTMALPLEYMTPKIPGLGDVDWGKFCSALTDIGFDGYGCIEIEDKSFEKSLDDVKRAIRQSAHYLKNFVT